MPSTTVRTYFFLGRLILIPFAALSIDHRSFLLLRGSRAATYVVFPTVAQMTLEEKVSLVQGAGRDSKVKKGNYVGRTPNIQRLGIPELLMNDGPQGFRGEPGTSTMSVFGTLRMSICGTPLNCTWRPFLSCDDSLINDVGYLLLEAHLMNCVFLNRYFPRGIADCSTSETYH